ncbi:DinB family protein [Georgenia alba]|uniref:DinB family protein n=1 Tax=Georgenia alba TaxID=2233858 RepID=A0ABW2Q545_9MICO
MLEHTDVDLRNSRFERVNLRGTRIHDSDLRGSRLRGVYLADADIDGELGNLVVNGVEVQPLIEAELDRRHPERAALRATTPDELRSGWAMLEEMWERTLERVDRMPPETTEISVDDEWSFSQTLRHLVLATDAWLGMAVLRRDKPFHPLGVVFTEWEGDLAELGLDAEATPSYAEVLEMRAGRVAMVRDYLAAVTADELEERRGRPPWASQVPTVRQCLGVIINEEWLHHRFAVRDLDAIEAGRA